MVLASAGGTQSLLELADLADKVMEVATPVISQVSNNPDVEQLRTEVADLKSLLKSMQHFQHRLVAPPAQLLSQHNLSVGITIASVKMPRSANLPAPGRETTKPVTDGDQ